MSIPTPACTTRSTNAHARKLLPMPVGPISSRLWRSAIQTQAPRVRTCWRLSRRGWVKSTASSVAGWRSRVAWSLSSAASGRLRSRPTV